jgi:hypothetical protein
MEAALDTLQKRDELPMPSVVVCSPLPNEEEHPEYVDLVRIVW